MSGIRVTYSGLISFAVSLVSIFTGLLFTLIVTRRLSPDEFGTWWLIGNLLTYVLIMEPTISFWVTREIARGIESGRTAILSSGLFSLAGIIIYLIIVYTIQPKINVGLEPLLISAFLVPVMFLNKTLSYINLGWKPHLVSYGILGFEVSKVPVSLIFVYFLNMGLTGAIITTIISNLVSIAILLVYAKEKIKNKIKVEFLKKWLKISWLPLYPSMSNLVLALDSMIYSLITGSVIGLAYFAASSSISNISAQSGNLSKAVYPKMLEGGKHEYVGKNITLMLYFSIPLTIMSIIFARPALFILNPHYEIAVIVVIVLSIKVFVDHFAAVFGDVLRGLEKVDSYNNATFQDYLKSRLFLVPTIRLIQFGSYISILAIGLLLFTKSAELNLVVYWSIVSLGASVFYSTCLYFLVRKSLVLKLNFRNLLKYILVGICVFGITYVFMEKFLIYDERFFVFLPNLIPYIGISSLSYLGITYLIDNRTKVFFNAIINEFKK